jgi:hypothetical protein
MKSHVRKKVPFDLCQPVSEHSLPDRARPIFTCVMAGFTCVTTCVMAGFTCVSRQIPVSFGPIDGHFQTWLACPNTARFP